MAKLLIILTLTLGESWAASKWDLVLESGVAWQTRNDVQIPNSASGTRFALDEADSGPFWFYRTEIFYRPAKNHGFRALYAPFEIQVQNTPASSITFDGTTFNAGESTTYDYKFNSYRLTYFYAFRGHGDSQLNVGFTAKIRDADVRLTQGARTENYDNVGFVPLFYFEYQEVISGNWLFHLSFDGLAGGPGRAFDVSLKLRRKFADWGFASIGTRFLEGGADNDKVYSFSLINYALVDLGLKF